MGRARGMGAQAVATTRAGAPPARGFAPTRVPDLKIQYTPEGHSCGRFEVGANQKEAIDLVRNGLGNGQRAFVVHGPTGAGKSTFIEQMAAILQAPVVVLGGTYDTNSAWDVHLSSDKLACDLELDGEQRDALHSLAGGPAVLSVGTHDAGLQKVLADALREGGTGTLIMSGSGGAASARAIQIHPAALVFFEVRGDGPEDSECLEFTALSDTTPVPYPELSELQRWRLAADAASPGVAWAEPIPRTAAYQSLDSSYGQTRAVRRAVADSEADQPLRAQLVADLVGVLGAVNPSAKSPQGVAFVERALANGEYQAYGGDNRADRTMRLQFSALFPVTERDPAAQNQIMADVLVPLQYYTDQLYNAGVLARGERPFGTGWPMTKRATDPGPAPAPAAPWSPVSGMA